jgi:uncharacterized UPF0146 family protein
LHVYVAIAHFIMVLRPTGEVSNVGAGQAAAVPAAVPDTELERLHVDAGGRRVRLGAQTLHYDVDNPLWQVDGE